MMIRSAIRLAPFLAFLLQGCTLIPEPSEERVYYVLPAPDCAPVERESEGSRPRLSLVNDTTNQQLLGHKILFSADPLSRGSYQYGVWTEPPGRRVVGLIEHALECSGAFDSVLRDAVPADSDIMLNVRLLDFYHDTSSRPGAVRIELTADLSTPERRSISSRKFTRTVEVRTFDARGAVEAFVKGLGEIVGELSSWAVEIARTRIAKTPAK